MQSRLLPSFGIDALMYVLTALINPQTRIYYFMNTYKQTETDYLIKL